MHLHARVAFLFPALLLLLLPSFLVAQKVLLIEKYGKAKTKKIYVGDEISYRLKGENGFRLGYIEDLRTDTNLIVLGRGYLSLEQIDAFQYDLRAPRIIGTTFMVFGLSWSFFAGVADLANLGYTYSASDAIVSGTSLALGFTISRFKKKTIRFGKRRRLRIVDLTPFSNTP